MDGGLVIKSCPALETPMDCSPRGFSIHGILQATYMGVRVIMMKGGSVATWNGFLGNKRVQFAHV